MKRTLARAFLALVSLVAAALALALFSVGKAEAEPLTPEEAAFVARIMADGVVPVGWQPEVVGPRLGHAICGSLAEGWSRQALIADLREASVARWGFSPFGPHAPSISQTADIVDSAHVLLCPGLQVRP